MILQTLGNPTKDRPQMEELRNSRKRWWILQSFKPLIPKTIKLWKVPEKETPDLTMRTTSWTVFIMTEPTIPRETDSLYPPTTLTLV
jgi:hypothetical protein